MKLTFMRFVNRFDRRMSRVPQAKRLPIALGSAIAISLALTVISVELYSVGGFSKLDLSRPGFERERNQVSQGDQQKVYDTTSPVTKSAVDSFLGEYDGYTKSLKTVGDFRDQALEDSDLQLGQ